MKSLGLLCLNEVNFELVEKYVNESPGVYKNLEYIIKQGVKKTSSESEYDLLEPWIQWPSVQTGLNYSDHKIFRLGDINDFHGDQIYETLESLGVRIGAISPMNASNRLKNPAYFVPDPWTQTTCVGSGLVKRLYQAIRQAVGDNASGKVEFSSKIYIFLGLIRYSRLTTYWKYLSVFRNRKSIPGSKALILDLLLNELHISLYRRHKPDFTQLFLNAFAHIQHHYMLSSSTDLVSQELKKVLKRHGHLENDPFPQALKVYDWIIGDVISLMDNKVVIATGLSQIPFDRLKYYYRLKDHTEFLRNIVKIDFESVNALMTRDFVINFATYEKTLEAEKALKCIKMKGKDINIFGEVQNRGNSLFVTLTYGDHIDSDSEITLENGDTVSSFESLVVFVAIKNGMHNSTGYIVTTNEKLSASIEEHMHVKNIGLLITDHFEKRVNL